MYGAHVGDGHDLFRVGFDAALGYNISQQFPLWNPKNTLFGIQLDVEPSEVHERRGQVCNQVASLSRFVTNEKEKGGGIQEVRKAPTGRVAVGTRWCCGCKGLVSI